VCGHQVQDELARGALVTPEELQRVIAKDQHISASPLRVSCMNHALRLVVAVVVTHPGPCMSRAQEPLLRRYLAAVYVTGEWLQHRDLVSQEFHGSHLALFEAYKQAILVSTALPPRSRCPLWCCGKDMSLLAVTVQRGAMHVSGQRAVYPVPPSHNVR